MNASLTGLTDSERREKSRAILAAQAEASARYQAENPSPYVARPDAARSSLAAQLERDSIDAARDAMRPDFAASVRAANRAREAKASAKLEAVEPVRTLADFDDQPCVKPTLDQLEKHLESLREMLAVHDDADTGAKALRGEERRRVRQTMHTVSALRAQMMLPALIEKREAAMARFVDESADVTGGTQSPEEYAEGLERKMKLGEMAKKICERLEQAGIEAFRDTGDVKLWRFFIHTQTLVQLPQYRRICINPAVAAQSRAGILSSLEFFCQEHRFCRFWTFTTGQRCFARDIPARLDEFNTKLRKMNYWLRKNHGLHIVIRAWEFGTLENHEDGNRVAEYDQSRINYEEDAKTGKMEPTYHPHMHCVVYSSRGHRPKEEWTALCEEVRKVWGFHCDFGGVIQNPREIVKYVTKPGDVLKLNIPQLREFFDVTTARRLVTPMGALKVQIAARKKAEKKLLRKRIRGDWKWIEVDDHNKTLSAAMTPEERAASDDMADAGVFEEECRRAANATSQLVTIDEVATYWADTGEVIRTPGGVEMVGGRSVPLKERANFCKVVAFLPPSVSPMSRVKENCVMVMGDKFDLAEVQRHPLVETLTMRTFTGWVEGREMALAEEAAGRSAIYLDTGTVTVPGFDDGPPGERRKRPVQLQLSTV